MPNVWIYRTLATFLALSLIFQPLFILVPAPAYAAAAQPGDITGAGSAEQPAHPTQAPVAVETTSASLASPLSLSRMQSE